MEVVKVKTEDGKERYYVADREGFPIEPVLKFIRFKDNTNYARNTLKMYCYHLKLYFEYLEQRGVDYQDITIDDLALFVNWLQSPAGNLKIIPINVVSLANVHSVDVVQSEAKGRFHCFKSCFSELKGLKLMPLLV